MNSSSVLESRKIKSKEDLELIVRCLLDIMEILEKHSTNETETSEHSSLSLQIEATTMASKAAEIGRAYESLLNTVVELKNHTIFHNYAALNEEMDRIASQMNEESEKKKRVLTDLRNSIVNVLTRMEAYLT
ncbi:hypothetical protein ACOME3_007146 [Neoechinorhynchus agilis]